MVVKIDVSSERVRIEKLAITPFKSKVSLLLTRDFLDSNSLEQGSTFYLTVGSVVLGAFYVSNRENVLGSPLVRVRGIEYTGLMSDVYVEFEAGTNILDSLATLLNNYSSDITFQADSVTVPDVGDYKYNGTIGGLLKEVFDNWWVSIFYDDSSGELKGYITDKSQYTLPDNYSAYIGNVGKDLSSLCTQYVLGKQTQHTYITEVLKIKYDSSASPQWTAERVGFLYDYDFDSEDIVYLDDEDPLKNVRILETGTVNVGGTDYPYAKIELAYYVDSDIMGPDIVYPSCTNIDIVPEDTTGRLSLWGDYVALKTLRVYALTDPADCTTGEETYFYIGYKANPSIILYRVNTDTYGYRNCTLQYEQVMFLSDMEKLEEALQYRATPDNVVYVNVSLFKMAGDLGNISRYIGSRVPDITVAGETYTNLHLAEIQVEGTTATCKYSRHATPSKTAIIPYTMSKRYNYYYVR